MTPPLLTVQQPTNNLPVQLTSFIGREAEIAQVQQLLYSQDKNTAKTHLVTITGPGGAGKTRLSLEVAAGLLNYYKDGIWLVELAPLTHEHLVEHNIATVLDIHPEIDITYLEALINYLKDKQLLLILDNCEHLLSRCAWLAQTLGQTCPGLQILATSREALSITGEEVWPLSPMSMPTTHDLQAASTEIVARLMKYETVQLFVERAVVAQPDFQISEQNATALLELCQRLDGLPLAIELAAARVKLLTVEQIALRLKDVFRVLNKGNRNHLPRQQTLRALIEWSYKLLSEPESWLLQRLAVFAGGWTLDAAQLVCKGGGLGQSEIKDLLQQLINKSLVVMVETVDHEIYYRLLETIRQYAAEKLVSSDYHEAVSRNHGEYYLQFAQEAEPKLRGFEQKQWLQRLELEHENLRAALQWFLQRSGTSSNEIEQGVKLASALWWFWWRRGHLVEGRRWLETALAKSWTGGMWLPRPILAKCTHALGGLAYHMSDYELAKQMWEESLKLKRELGDLQGLSYTLNNLGEMAQRQGEYRRAIALHEESLVLKRETGDRWGTAYSLNELGTILQRQGEYGKAKTMLEEGLALFEETGHRHGVARSYHNLGKVVLCLGDYEQAHDLHQRSQVEFEQLGEKQGIGDALDSLGMLALFKGNYSEAKALIQKSLLMFQEVGDRWGVSYALNDLGLCALAQEELERGIKFFEQSLSLKQKLKDKESIAWTLEGLAFAAALAGKIVQSGRLWGAVDGLRAKLGTPIPPANSKFYQALLPVDFNSANSTDFVTARQSGYKMSLEQAIMYATATDISV